MTDRINSPSRPTSARRQRTRNPMRAGSAAQREFATRINHTLRGDVHTVRLALEAALEQTRAVALPASTREALKRVERAVVYLERRALDITLLTQLESGALELDRQPHRIKWTLLEAIKEYRNIAAKEGVKLRSDLAALGTTPAPLDRKLVVRALGALLDNAIRFSPRGGVVTIHGERDGRVARVTVRDQGDGFAPGDDTRIFAPFAAGTNVKNGSGNGLGLGLAVARAIIEAHGGSIFVVKSANPGGAVAIELPLA